MGIIKNAISLFFIHTLIWLVCLEHPSNPQKFFECLGAILLGGVLGALILTPPNKKYKLKPLRWEFSKPKTCERKGT